MHIPFGHNLMRVTNYEKVRRDTKCKPTQSNILKLPNRNVRIKLCSILRSPFKEQGAQQENNLNGKGRFELPLGFQWSPIFRLIMLLFQLLVCNLLLLFTSLWTDENISCLFVFTPQYVSLSKTGTVPYFPLTLRPIFGKWYKSNIYILNCIDKIWWVNQWNKKKSHFSSFLTTPSKWSFLYYENIFTLKL